MRNVVFENPPNLEALQGAFGPLPRGVLFAFGDKIYNPDAVPIPPQLMEHEEEHCVRQEVMGVDKWWEQYIADKNFRFQEELVAHRREYEWFLENKPEMAQRALRYISQRLSGPLYGRVSDYWEAKNEIKRPHMTERDLMHLDNAIGKRRQKQAKRLEWAKRTGQAITASA